MIQEPIKTVEKYATEKKPFLRVEKREALLQRSWSDFVNPAGWKCRGRDVESVRVILLQDGDGGLGDLTKPPLDEALTPEGGSHVPFPCGGVKGRGESGSWKKWPLANK